ncbi:hypothetical protein EV426DRAFT_444639 [Tirmania nivea]|nr:hypothetical protein EV426DRAFT_444639 [Tirmania nivea]
MPVNPQPLILDGSHIFNPSEVDFALAVPRVQRPLDTTLDISPYAYGTWRTVALTNDDDTAIQDEYCAIRPAIIAMLLSTFPETKASWGLTAVGRVFHATLRQGSNPLQETFTPTIYIVCSEPSRLDAELRVLALQTPLRIEVRPGQVDLFGKLSGPGCPWYKEKVNMGRSIAPVHSSGSGTFGGWTLEPKTGRRLGLSAGHVYLMGKRMLQLPVSSAEIELQQPSPQDYTNAVEEAVSILNQSTEISARYGFLKWPQEKYGARRRSYCAIEGPFNQPRARRTLSIVLTVRIEKRLTVQSLRVKRWTATRRYFRGKRFSNPLLGRQVPLKDA